MEYMRYPALKSKNQNILIPQGKLSNQQKQIYKLYCEGFTNKEIAAKLDLSQRVVATQLLRIRKKAANLNLTYKIEPGAEHALNQRSTEHTAFDLKRKMQEDPGFFKLMFSRYATNEETKDENRYQLASTGLDPSLLFSTRAKMLTVLGNTPKKNMFVVKIDKNNRKVLKDFFQKQKIRPLEVFWDDGSGTYLVKEHELEIIKQLLVEAPSSMN
jgi:DNA-binding CsgD family transcriptional regulator